MVIAFHQVSCEREAGRQVSSRTKLLHQGKWPLQRKLDTTRWVSISTEQIKVLLTPTHNDGHGSERTFLPLANQPLHSSLLSQLCFLQKSKHNKRGQQKRTATTKVCRLEQHKHHLTNWLEGEHWVSANAMQQIFPFRLSNAIATPISNVNADNSTVKQQHSNNKNDVW